MADETNSWLLYDDPQGRFHLRHPQELEIEDIEGPDAWSLPSATSGREVGHADRRARTQGGGLRRDRKWSDPQAFVREVQQNCGPPWREVVNGEMGWLPEQEWAPLKRRVYRI